MCLDEIAATTTILQLSMQDKKGRKKRKKKS